MSNTKQSKCKCGNTFTQYFRNGIPTSKHCPDCNKRKKLLDKPKEKSLKIQGNVLMQQADKVFGDWIKEYYSRTINGKKGCFCFTCKEPMTIEETQAGHYMKRSNMSTRYHILNVRPQCNNCNSTLIGDGMQAKFREQLIIHHGLKAVEELEMLSRQVCKVNDLFFLEIIAKYKHKK